MTPEALLNDIVAAISAMKPRAMIKGYVFGSVLRPGFHWSDIDILVVCGAAEDVPHVRMALELLCHAAPIDLLLMSSAEEAELDFVSEQGCVPLFELSAMTSHVQI